MEAFEDISLDILDTDTDTYFPMGQTTFLDVDTVNIYIEAFSIGQKDMRFPEAIFKVTTRDGTTKADQSVNVKTNQLAKVFSKAESVKLFNQALAAKPKEAAILSIRARNYTSADKSVFAELAALAKKNGVKLTVHFDTVVGGMVTNRISVDPATMQANLDLAVKILGNKITLPKFKTPTSVAVKMPANTIIDNLKISQNGKEVTNAKPWLDKNGYLHFTTTGGEIVLSVK